jgi:glycerol-3-phosphate O-acyltransferase
MAEGVGHLCEMSGLHNKRVSDAWQRVGSWLTRDYDNVIDDEGLAQLRRLGRKHALIFLISHRSYLDEFILPPPVQAGDLSPLFGTAEGNLNFFSLGPVARRTGIIHVRRAAADIPNAQHMNTGRPADRTTPHSAPRAVPGEGATQP